VSAFRPNRRSPSAGQAGFSLGLAAASVVAIYATVMIVADSRVRAEMRAEIQASADAAAVGSVTELPKGTIAVVRAAGRILGSQKAGSLVRRFGSSKVEIGHWDAEGQSFTTSAAKPNAVRIAIRLRDEAAPFAAFPRVGDSPIEAHAVAVFEPRGNSLVAQACATSTSAIR